MKNMSWKKHPNSEIHSEYLELTNPSQINTIRYATIAFYVGQYKDYENYQVSLESKLACILDTNKDFKTLKECKDYVETSFKNWVKNFE